MEATTPDLVTCNCNSCGGHLQFERGYAGQRTDCPHCGMETLLYIPPTTAPCPQEGPTVSPYISSAVGEGVFLSEGGIVVTKTRFMVYGQTYALANITSVQGLKLPPPHGWPLLLGGLGLLLLFIGLGLSDDSATKVGAYAAFTFGAALTIVGVFWLMTSKNSYAVVLSTSGGEIKTCISRDVAFIDRVVEALNEAIVARG